MNNTPQVYILFFGSDEDITDEFQVSEDEVLGVFSTEDEAKSAAEHVFDRAFVWEDVIGERFGDWIQTVLQDGYWLSIEPWALGKIDTEMVYASVPNYLMVGPNAQL